MRWYDGVIDIEGESFTADQVIETLLPRITPDRREKTLDVVRHRDHLVAPVLERIYDRGNISAVMRSAEAFGFYQFYVVENPGEKFKEANRVTAGTDKWVRLETFKESKPCFDQLKADGFNLLVSDLKAPEGMDHIDLSKKWAVVFGNEKDGISDLARETADARYKIPMKGFAESFNISVAAALTFQYLSLGRKKQDLGPADETKFDSRQRQILANYLLRSVSHSNMILKRLS